MRAVSVPRLITAVLHLLHGAADAVATVSPGRAEGAILRGLNAISRHLRLLENNTAGGGASSGDSDDGESEESEGGGGSGHGWGSDDDGPSWADEDDEALAPGDGEYGL